MAERPTPPRPVDKPAEIPPPPPYQPDPKLITYIERDQRPKREQREH